MRYNFEFSEQKYEKSGKILVVERVYVVIAKTKIPYSRKEPVANPVALSHKNHVLRTFSFYKLVVSKIKAQIEQPDVKSDVRKCLRKKLTMCKLLFHFSSVWSTLEILIS